MSKESLQWLNTNTLIGCTDKRGTAWHWRAQEQGEQSNHYPGAIPVTDVQDRLFGWQAESRRLAVELPAAVVDATHWQGGLPRRWAVVADRQAICRSDDDTLMGIFGAGYTRHQYPEWLLTTVADLLDDDLVISSAGLLRGGAIAWVEVSMPDTITTPEGVAFRPNLLATTSFDGSIATTYKRTVTDTVCDNTRELALSERGQEVKVKHSRNSHAQLAPARQALAMVHTLGGRLRRRGRQAVPGGGHAQPVGGVPGRPHAPPRQRRHRLDRQEPDDRRPEAGQPHHALPGRPQGGALGRYRTRRPAGHQHLRAPRRSPELLTW